MSEVLTAARTGNEETWLRVKSCTDDFRYFALTLALLFLVHGPLSGRASAFEGGAPDHLQCEAMREPLGIDIAHPRLSWQLQDSRRGARQAGYEIRVASSSELLAQDRADVWDSGRVASDQSVNVSYGGPPVESRRRYYWSGTGVGSAGATFSLQPA